MQTMFMVGGRVFHTPQEAIEYGKSIPDIDIFAFAKVNITKSYEIDIPTHLPMKEALKKIKKVI
jgi:hypothetical protein